jgi:hypothetical protein
MGNLFNKVAASAPMRKVLAVGLAAGTILVVLGYFQTTGAQQCDKSLWQHVYNPTRLIVKNECISVSGTIVSHNPDPDGDFHIRVRLDPQYSSLLTPANTREGGNLVVEPVCQHAPSQPDAIQACKNFSKNISIPSDGSHVTITGSYVLDKHHGGWAEIHPVTSIEKDR